jgi:hypothetical protein
MRNLAMMQYTFDEHAGSRLLVEGGMESDINNARFMAALISVMQFICESKGTLFTKPYIAFLLEQEERDCTQSCFMSFKACQIGDEIGKSVCGYVHFTPCPEKCSASSEHTCFFLLDACSPCLNDSSSRA